MEDRLRKILPCPFCGSDMISAGYHGQPATHLYFICLKCAAQGPVSELPQPLDAKTHWNTRATDPLMEEMAKALEKSKEYLDEYRPHGHVLDQIEEALQEYRERENAK